MKHLIYIFLALAFVITAKADNNPGTYTQLEKASGSVVNNKKVLYGAIPEDSLVKPILVKYVVNEMIDIRPMDGHHFNLKANNNCDMQKPATLKQNFIQCQFNEAGVKKLNLFICDDKESFCKLEKLGVDIVAPQGYQSALKKRVSSNILYVPKAELKAPPGFIKDKAKFATDKALKENKPLLISFSAQWCPSCNLLDENVYQSEAFQKDTKDFVKLILDVDSDLSWDLKEKFRVGAYPTVIVTTSTLNEVSRIVGYRSPQAMSAWIKLADSQKNEPIEFVLSKIEAMKDSAKNPQFKPEYDKKVLRVAQWYLDQDLADKALDILKRTDAKTAERLSLQAELVLAQKNNDKEKSIKTLEQLISKYPDDVYVTPWELSLSQLDVDKAKKYLPIAEKNLQKWGEGDQVEATEFLKSDLYEAMAEAFENLDEAVKARQNYSLCAQDYTRLAKQSLIKTPRGANLEKAYCMIKGGDTTEALSLLENLAKTYREEFAFNYYYAKALNDTGDTTKALEYVKKALSGSYGDNMIRAATLKAQIEIAAKDLKAAEMTVNQTLAKIYLPTTTQIRTHRYVTNLKAVLAKIEIQKQAKLEPETDTKKQ